MKNSVGPTIIQEPKVKSYIRLSLPFSGTLESSLLQFSP